MGLYKIKITRRNMSTNTLKSIAQRGSMLFFAVGLVVATIAPATVSADALNPLTERSLLLTSSSPGWHDSDGSGNSEDAPGVLVGSDGEPLPGHYALPGSGPNGKKTGQTFSFRVSTDSRSEAAGGTGRAIKAFTLQYCTTAAGICLAPGDNEGGTEGVARGADTDSTSDLNVNYTGAVAGTDFQIFIGDDEVSTGWTMATDNVETPIGGSQTVNTGKNNFIRLTNATGISPAFNDKIRIVFNASSTKYITNPGSGSFFVKMNTYDSENAAHHVDALDGTEVTTALVDSHLIDGGVTVANVMTTSIHITTKVLETMAFSVGTINPDTTIKANPADHGTCEAITTATGNRLQLGNPIGEYSLETTKTWDVESFWRLSSNSSGGATVYYSGDTLRNSVGDWIESMEAKGASVQGTEQFGLAFIDPSAVSTSFQTQVNLGTRWKVPNISPLNMHADYADGNGYINGKADDTENEDKDAAQFRFLVSSLSSPVVIASNNDQVLSCATGKMRYIGNIGADTPAGVYTTKINYLAAPQY